MVSVRRIGELAPLKPKWLLSTSQGLDPEDSRTAIDVAV